MDQQAEARFTVWAKGKPVAVAASARLAVESVGPLREFMEYRRTSAGPFALEPAIDSELWLSFCRRKTLVRSFCEALFGPEAGSSIFRVYRTLENPKAASPVELYLAWAMICTAFLGCEAVTSEAEMPPMPAGELEEGLPDLGMNLPMMQFAMRTAIPCWFVYGALPHQLLWNVCGDDQTVAEQSVERLVRLDPRFVHQPIIRHWVGSDVKLAPFRAGKLREWQRRRTPFDKPKTDSYWLRVVPGLVAAISELLDHRLKEPELRELAEILQWEVPEDAMKYIRDKTNDDLSREIRRKNKHFRLPDKPDRSVFSLVRESLKKLAQYSGHDPRCLQG